MPDGADIGKALFPHGKLRLEPGENGRSRTDFTDKNAIKFNLKVECPSLATLQKMAGNKKVEYLTVYSKSLEMEPLGKQADLPAGKQGLVHDDIILIKLAPGQVRASPLSDA